jgi:phosphoenolpyruvate carboxykinase (GTP)
MNQSQTSNRRVHDFVREIVRLTQPAKIHWCDGSQEEFDTLCSEMVQRGTLTRLNIQLRPNCYLARTHPEDVARVEERTYICSTNKEAAGPTNNWNEPTEMRERLNGLFTRCMRGRTLYVVPFCMGPLGSPFAVYGVEITDSPYVVCNMRIMTRMGQQALDALGDEGDFVPCVHSVGMPLAPGDEDATWPCNPKMTVIAHFPEDKSIWSFGSGYGGNALLGKKSLALRIASLMGHEEGWLAEHMLLSRLTSPTGESMVFAAAFPSGCGKTNLAMLVPPESMPGWKVTTLGDDIAWLRPSSEGTLHAINPENGLFGIAPGTNWSTNPAAMQTLSKNSFFTNTALTADGDVWWEGLTESPPTGLLDWQGKPWTPECKHPAAHPNARFTAPLQQCPCLDEQWNHPLGVTVDALLFGGRRDKVYPLVVQSFSWSHGVYLGATLSSETTHAAKGVAGKVRRDPFAMLPFCGHNMGDHFELWLSLEHKLTRPPLIFHVNWFLKNKNGSFAWPGFGENMRVLKWVLDRVQGHIAATHTPVGWVPIAPDFLTEGLSSQDFAALGSLFAVDVEQWLHEAALQKEFLNLFGSHLPHALENQHLELVTRLYFEELRKKERYPLPCTKRDAVSMPTPKFLEAKT